MNKVLALITFLCIGAMATPINLSGANGEQTLQEILDSITVTPTPGVSSINVITDQLSSDEIWTSTASGGAIATFIIEIATFANTNSFGICDLTSASFLEIFSGPQREGSQATLKFYDNGLITVSNDSIGRYGEATFSSNNFGFYLGTNNFGTFYSQASKNSDGLDHMVAFQGNNIDELKIAPFKPGVWTSDEYILAWEDVPVSTFYFDADYNDLVVLIESVRPVPEPASLSLIGIGLATMLSSGFFKRKRS